VIGLATHPVPVSVPKLVKTLLGLVVLLVTARLSVVHITLQQGLRHLPRQGLPPNRPILQQVQSVIPQHPPIREMLHIAIELATHLATVSASKMAIAIEEQDVLAITV
jgi:hypothetical protein